VSCRIRRGQKIFAFIRRCIRTGFCSPDLADFHDLYLSSDEKLFNKILTCSNHILRTLLPPPTAQNYSLRNRPHSRQLPDRISRITDCNFTVRMLYRNMYRLLYILDLRFVLFLCTTAVWQFAINEYVMSCYGVRLSAIKRPAEKWCLQPSFEGDQRWRCDDVRWQSVANARSGGDCESAVADGDTTRRWDWTHIVYYTPVDCNPTTPTTSICFWICCTIFSCSW